MKSKQKVIMVLVVLAILLITVGVSYSIFNYVQEGNNENSIKLGDITFKYTEDKTVGNGISITDALPISDEEGKRQTGEGKVFDFSVESNLSRSDLEYEIVAEETEDSTLPLDVIKLYMTDITSGEEVAVRSTIDIEENVKTLESYLDTEIKNVEGKTIYKETILKNTRGYSKKFRVRMWIKEGLDWSDERYLGKSGAIRINVYANSDRSMTSSTVTTPDDVRIERIIVNDVYLFEKVNDESYHYTVTVPKEITVADIKVIPTNTEATVEISSMNDNDDFTLKVGENYFKATVISSNGTKRQEYTLRIEREKDAINTLKSLGVKGYSVTPTFNSDIQEYTLTLEETSVEITAEATSSVARITGMTGTQELDWGKNEITITVTAQNGDQKNYKIIITNQRPTAPVIQGGSDELVSIPPTISIEIEGTAISGVKEYEYYKSTNSTPPTEETEATGTTTGNLTINNDGTTYIWYRTVSQNENRSEWSSPQVTNFKAIKTSDNTIKKVSYPYDGEFWKYRFSITKIIIQNELKPMEGLQSWNISESGKGNIIAYYDPSTTTVYIQGDGKIYANENSSYLFYYFSSLIEIESFEYVDTSYATDMSLMFFRDYKLKSLDFSKADISQVKDTSNMFYRCESLTTTINITSNSVTNYTSMFITAAIEPGAQITVNYTNETSDLVDKMIATKGSGNVVKGDLIN